MVVGEKKPELQFCFWLMNCAALTLNHLQSCPGRHCRITVAAQPSAFWLALNRKRPSCPDSQLYLNGQVDVFGGYTVNVSNRCRGGRWLLRIQAVPLALRAKKRRPCVCWILWNQSCWDHKWRAFVLVVTASGESRKERLSMLTNLKQRKAAEISPSSVTPVGANALWHGWWVRACAHGGTSTDGTLLQSCCLEWN